MTSAMGRYREIFCLCHFAPQRHSYNDWQDKDYTIFTLYKMPYSRIFPSNTEYYDFVWNPTIFLWLFCKKNL